MSREQGGDFSVSKSDVLWVVFKMTHRVTDDMERRNPPWQAGVNLSALIASPWGEEFRSLVLGSSYESSESAVQSGAALLWSLRSLFLKVTSTVYSECELCMTSTLVLLLLIIIHHHHHFLRRQSMYLFSRLPFLESRNPLANGLFSIFSCVIWIQIEARKENGLNSLSQCKVEWEHLAIRLKKKTKTKHLNKW